MNKFQDLLSRGESWEVILGGSRDNDTRELLQITLLHYDIFVRHTPLHPDQAQLFLNHELNFSR